MARNMDMTEPQILAYKNVNGRLHICHSQAQTYAGLAIGSYSDMEKTV
jgi:hypothetical protein